MSEQRSGRKKHIVEGEVSTIKRGSQGLGTRKQVGTGGFMRAFRRLVKGIKNEEKK